jgi:hypothetical protein
MTTSNKRSLSQQLWEAYNASLRDWEEVEEQGRHQHLPMATMTPSGNYTATKSTLPMKRCEMQHPTSSTRENASNNNNNKIQISHRDNTTKTLMLPTLYRLDPSMLEAWNQIGGLFNDIGHTTVVKQAEILNHLARSDHRLQEEELFQHDPHQQRHHVAKKPKLEKDAIVKMADEGGISGSSNKRGVVSASSEEEEDDSGDEDTVAVSSLSSSASSMDRGDDGDLLEPHAERMIRMTTCLAEMERLHALFRLDMEALARQSEECLSE